MKPELPLAVIENVRYWLFTSQKDFKVKLDNISPKAIIKTIKKSINSAIECISNRDNQTKIDEIFLILNETNPVIEAILITDQSVKGNLINLLITLNELHDLFTKENYFKEYEVFNQIVTRTIDWRGV